MKTQEIESGNKLIAEFMGCPYHMNDEDCEYYEVWHDELIPVDSLEYHTKWDWLMPVVEKIEKELGFDVIITLYSCMIGDTADGFREDKISSTWWAIVKFITWYNKQ